MNKTELIAAAAEQSGMKKKDAERVIEAAIDIITAQLSKGERVQLTGFGTLEVKDRAARIGRNPHTGEATQIEATRVATFKPGKALKELISK